MRPIIEPPGVTFTVVNKRLTEADKKALSLHIQTRKQKEQQANQRKRKKTTS